MSTPKTYRISALASGFVRMWRAWAVIVPVIIVNALVQGALVFSPSVNDGGALAVLLGVVSAVIFLIALGLLLACTVQVADGRVSWSSAVARLRERAGPYLLATIGYALVAIIGLSIYTYPGWIVLCVGIFVPIAAMAGPGNPVTNGLRAVGRRPVRWLVTVLITAAIVLLGSYLMGVTAFFIRGFAASSLVWLIAGFVLAWLATAFSLIYRTGLPANQE